MSWDPNPNVSPWHDTPGTGFETRRYRVDYEASNDKGYDWNFNKVPATVQVALNDYRTANDGTGHHATRGFDGIRYAASRVDVVGHSMGGVLTRLWISDASTPSAIPRADRPSRNIWVFRSGLENYLEGSMYGVGSIRRFISIGSPFDGSGLAVFAREGYEALAAHNRLRRHINLPAITLPASNTPTTPILPTEHVPEAILDLAPNSFAQQWMDGASYPYLWRRVLWHPIYTVASQDIQYTQWDSNYWGAALDRLQQLRDDPVILIGGQNGDLVVNTSSQTNGQPVHGTLFQSTLHCEFPLLSSIKSQLRSEAIRDRVRELLSTGSPLPWSGDLSR